MTYFELLEQFWQLDAERSIAPAASKLYFYLLNEFNSATPRWPAHLYRRANQVSADLNTDKKTLSSAAATLVQRGLIYYAAGTKTASAVWQLTHGRPPLDSSAVRRKNSPQARPDSSGFEGKNSPSSPTNTLDSSAVRGKNSPSIRNRPVVVVTEQTTPLASACVGEAAEEITLAPVPTEALELVPPVAEPPHAAESRPVAAAELPAVLATEAKALASTIALLWHVSELKNYTKWARVAAFTHRLAQLGRLDEVKLQHGAYSQQRQCAGIRPHALDTYLGTPARDYQDGEWCGCDWVAVAADTRPRGSQAGPVPTPARATTSHQKTAAQSWS